MLLKKGQKVDITKGNFGLNEIIVTVGWNQIEQASISAFLVQDNGSIRNNKDFLNKNNRIDADNAVEFFTENNIKINLNKVSRDIKKLSVVISTDTTLNRLSNLYISLTDANSKDEFIKYEVTDNLSNERAIILGEIYRHNGEWKFNCIGSGFGGFEALADNFGYKSLQAKPEVKREVKKETKQNSLKREETKMSFGFGSSNNNRGNKRSHEIDYEIMGENLQVVEVELDPAEIVIAEAGAMNWMDDGISFEAKMGDGSKPQSGFFGSLLDAGKRAVMGESIFLTHFTNQGHGKKRVAFSAPYPGKILPIDLANYGGEITCQKDAFLCAAYGTAVDITFSKKLGAGFFGGEGFILQSLKGDGMAFVHAGGTIVEKKLNGEKLKVDTGCIVGFTNGIDYDIERAGNLKSMLFGGEGLFLATLKGHGTVWLQSLPFSRLADRIIKNAPSVTGQQKGEGSILGELGRLIDGK